MSDETWDHRQIAELWRRSLDGELVVAWLLPLLRHHLREFHGGCGDARTAGELYALHERLHAT